MRWEEREQYFNLNRPKEGNCSKFYTISVVPEHGWKPGEVVRCDPTGNRACLRYNLPPRGVFWLVRTLAVLGDVLSMSWLAQPPLSTVVFE